MSNVVTLFLFCLGAYLCGSIPFAKLIGQYHGIDIQKQGSGNIGFANTVRVLGWQPGLLVLIGDSMKGYLPVALAAGLFSSSWLALIGLFAIIGHIFPIWLKFRGGKGIATGLGITLALQPVLALLGLGVYVLTLLLTRKSAVGSILAAWSIPAWCLAAGSTLGWFYLGLAIFATWTHRTNIHEFTKRKIVYDD